MMNETKICPDIWAYADMENKHFFMEITIPGVKETDICLKILEDRLSLSAPVRNNDIIYKLESSFCHPVIPYKTNAHYKDGLLKIEVPFKHNI